jgi:hypothetical protein
LRVALSATIKGPFKLLVTADLLLTRVPTSAKPVEHGAASMHHKTWYDFPALYARNAEGTAQDRSPFGSWRDVGKAYGQRWNRCCVLGCNGPADVGAHLDFDALPGRRIGPMCYSHNAQHGEAFWLDGNIVYPPAVDEFSALKQALADYREPQGGNAFDPRRR